MIKIELARTNELDRIKCIAEACAKDMINNNIFQWNENYPSKDVFKDDIENNSLYVCKSGSMVIGCIMLCSEKDKVYKDVNWLTKDYKNLYLHRLAVDPSFQKNGIGRLLMDFAEKYAKNNKYKSIRLDTFSKNKRNNKFYRSRKYVQLDDVFFPMQSEFPFHCYEKIIS
jgi:ribosomal protein S18 acetylase RimI-like enzyme|tara:strand:+ start:685 stop:1194 length:510 start_codon:yes stop_codon:yes gene_type:complete